MKKIKINNARLLSPFRVIEDACILIERGKITRISQGNFDEDGAEVIDAKNHYVSPGFIDIHTHGAGGYDFMDGNVESFLGAAQMQAKHGVTSVVPTTLTSTNEELFSLFEAYREAKKKNTKGARFLGLHLEGPYFSLNQRGAQDPKYIKVPKKKDYEEILSHTDDIIRWSAAPEIPGALEFGRYVSSKGILAAIGHSDADYDEVVRAMENGYTHVTHLYSGMSGVMRKNAYRYAGVIESAFLLDQLTVEIIADGNHLPASLLRLIYQIKGPSRIALITDSMRGAGMGPGKSILGSLKKGTEVIIEDGVAKLPDRTAFAGSVATGDLLVRNMIQLAGVPLLHAVQMMTTTPAKICGCSHNKGIISEGMDADVVVFDDQIKIKTTIINGKVVYNNLK